MKKRNFCFLTIVLFVTIALNAQTVKDIDGNVYKTIKIGNQTWMAENLKTTHFKDGSSIPIVADNKKWSNLTTPGCCWYDNDEATYKNTYGALYNWYTVNTGNLCPSGWHVPTDEEWTQLTDYLGGRDVAGGKLKEKGTAHWIDPNTGATNETGFTALPGGSRDFIDGSFGHDIGIVGYWWSATEYYYDYAWRRYLNCNFYSVLKDNHLKRNGFSVRCLRD